MSKNFKLRSKYEKSDKKDEKFYIYLCAQEYLNERKDYIKNKYNLCILPKVRYASMQAASLL